MAQEELEASARIRGRRNAGADNREGVHGVEATDRGAWDSKRWWVGKQATAPATAASAVSPPAPFAKASSIPN